MPEKMKDTGKYINKIKNIITVKKRTMSEYIIAVEIKNKMCKGGCKRKQRKEKIYSKETPIMLTCHYLITFRKIIHTQIKAQRHCIKENVISYIDYIKEP